MNRYLLSPQAEMVVALGKLEAGVQSIGIVRGHPMHPGCASCEIETTDGNFVHLFAGQHDLEFKFEVFPLLAEAPAPEFGPEVERTNFHLAAPVVVTLLETEEWLDPDIPCGESIGQNPIIQRQGSPGSTPESALASCRYVGGICLTGADGGSLFITTASFPYTLHVQGLAEDDRMEPTFYRPVLKPESSQRS